MSAGSPSLSPLPMDAVLPRCIEALHRHGSIVVRAPTGSGKTTRLPVALLEAGLCGTGRLVMLEPRRVAARAAAMRMATERGQPVGQDIGYQVRFEQRVSRATRLFVVTDGVLLRMLHDDPFLERFQVVVFDEFHERGLNIDLALGMVRRIQQTVRPDLKIVVMSATLQAESIAGFLDDCPILESTGRLFPVEIQHWVPPVPELATLASTWRTAGAGGIAQLAAAGVRQALELTRGDLLAFLPGVGEIQRTASELTEVARRENLLVLPLYGDLPADQQDAVLRRAERRKVVLATNVAETSLTIEGITGVIDTGLARVLRFDDGTGIDKLELSRISRASADQRAGRAGRTSPGVCIRLWSERDHLAFPPQELPEIQRVDLTGAVLQLLAWGEADPLAFPWFESPRATQVEQALKLLWQLEAIDDARRVTPLGQEMVRLPVHPRVARLLLAGRDSGHTASAALAAALLTERDPFLRSGGSGRGMGGGLGNGPPGRGGPAHGSRRAAAHRSQSDVGDRVTALEDFERTGSADTWLGRLHVDGAKYILRTRDQLLRALREDVAPAAAPDASRRNTGSDVSRAAANAGHPKQSNLADDTRRGEEPAIARRSPSPVPGPGERVSAEEALRRGLLAAYPDRLAKRRGEGSLRGLMVGGKGVRLEDRSAVTEATLFVCVDTDAGGSEVLVRQASAVERDWLPERELTVQEEFGFDPDLQRVQVVRRTCWFDLPLDEVSLSLPDSHRVTECLVEAATEALDKGRLPDILPANDAELEQFLSRVRSLREWMPELKLPGFLPQDLAEVLPALCAGRSSFAELRRGPWLDFLQGALTPAQRQALEREAPERLLVPSGNRIRLQYEAGRPPILAVRIQEIFGLRETPRIAGGRVRVLLHLLAPNMRAQQITDDLPSFWTNTYPEVRKELRRRYPKHSWPEDPRQAVAEKRPTRKHD